MGLLRFSSPRVEWLRPLVMAKPDLELIGKALIGVVEGVVLPDGAAVEEIRPATGAYEKGVGGE